MDRTYDIQTAGIVAALIDAFAGAPSEILMKWIKSYEDLLNQLHLFEDRAVFTIRRCEMKKAFMGEEANFMKNKGKVASPIGVPAAFATAFAQEIELQQKPFKYCTCCGQKGTKPISPSFTAEKTPIEYCPGCARLLPRCTICLFPLGIARGLSPQQESSGG